MLAKASLTGNGKQRKRSPESIPQQAVRGQRRRTVKGAVDVGEIKSAGRL